MAIFTLSAAAEKEHRTTLSLDGQWDVEDSTGANEMPKTYHHTTPVPGLTHSALPAFPDVDQYQTRQLLSNLVEQGRYDKAEYDKLGDARGISHQQRNYFWYRKTFQAPAQEEVALLKVNKAQFSAVVYLNGMRIGEHDPCFTAAYFDVTQAIRWNAMNRLRKEPLDTGHL
jgi:beta-galactosidase/beta-glucuronidase